MSSPRVQKIFEGMPDQLKRLGGYTFKLADAIVWQGRATAGTHAGKDACVLDLTSATWADGNLRAIIVATPASDKGNTAAMKTQSHASGHFLDGSVKLAVYMETPEAWTDAQANFSRLLQQHIVGQLACPCEFFFGTNDVEPTVQGVNSAGADSAGLTSAGTLLPYGGVAYPGGI